MGGLMRGLAALGLAATLASCGDGAGGQGGESPFARLAQIVPGFSGGGRNAAETATPGPGFSAAELAAAPGDYRLIWLPSFFGQPGLARRVQDNGARETFESQYGFTASFDGGILTGTRGLPDDLIGATAAATRAALNAGGGQLTRVHDTLDGLDQIVQSRFDCTVTYNGTESVDLGARQVTGRKFTEACTSPRLVFENLYWLDGSGSVFASRQFVSQTVAYLRFNRP